MTDHGLTTRLRQHSRRAGIAVGLTMALTVLLCVALPVVIYARLNPLTTDFVAAPTAETDARPTPTRRPRQSASADPTRPPADDDAAPTPTPAPPDPTPTPEQQTFSPDFQSSSQGQINFRSGPGTEFEVLTVLTLAQPLQYLSEDAPTANPAEDGNRWMKFRTEDGLEGWIREIDSEPYDPNA